MLYVYIVQLVAVLAIMIFLAVNVSKNTSEVKLNFNKVAMLYSKEKVLLEASEMYIEKNSATPSDIQAIKDDDLLSDNYSTENYFGGNYTIYFVDNNHTLRLCHNIDNEKVVNIYTKHYLGREFGISPKEVESDECSNDGNNVYHDYPLRIQSVDAL